jgi:hypothetical protein
MRSPSHFTGLACILVILMLLPGQTVSAASQPLPAAQVDCASLISQLTAADNWLEQLADPVLDTQAQVIQRFRYY